jgi:hypothetical protein
MFSSLCKSCGWESEPAAAKEAAAGAGLMHLATAHAHALALGDVSAVRILTFDTLQAAVRDLAVGFEPAPEPEEGGPKAGGQHRAATQHERAKEPEKKRH